MHACAHTCTHAHWAFSLVHRKAKCSALAQLKVMLTVFVFLEGFISSPFALVQQAFALVQQAFALVQQAFALVQWAFTSVHEYLP